MSKNELLTFCRHYQGEAEPPARLGYENRNLWKYEEIWVGMMENGSENAFEDFLSAYHRDGLSKMCETDNVPMTLKALLYNRFQFHNDGMGNVEDFKKWYIEKYSH